MSAFQPYYPHYDPLHSDLPGQGMDYAPSYWRHHAGEPPEDDGAVSADMDVDVVLIGGGFTGLATALFLAREYGIKATVLEANQIGWGCTSRNGGQGHLAWGRLSRRQWVKKWGADTARRLHANTLEGFEVFQSMAEDPEIDCEPQNHGNLLVAHSPQALKELQAESRLCHDVLGYKTHVLDRDTVLNEYIGDQESFGAFLEPVGIAVQPLKLAYGYARLARKLGARIHTASPVQNWTTEGGIHHLQTPGGVVRTRAVGIATAGYTSPSLHKLTAYRNMPIMANSVWTRTLTDEEIEACGFRSTMIVTDTRKLRYYYRFLPEKRLQIGTRSAISGADAQNPKHLKVVHEAIARKFPALAGIETPWFSHGWMDISHDMMPRIVQPDASQQIFYAQGYSGNGVAFSAYASKKLATLIAGGKIPESDLPIFSSPLPAHPLRPIRRMGQRALYKYFQMLDTVR
ncbi:FAD-binding oxidoreductase [Halomonas sp. KAO]|uniref:NAD(P)/FAD-dependent oxidoreductase n=1 Tax=unclassified Halomonas TaxID=2609666 RepID=UPI00189E459E|nr:MULTISPECIES: FAD-binding oxidoreductase [unclassified Halomonas]MBF7053035.1 FAD-binding oxidoreductase [Halomonas sp. KAO]MDT0500665.1 FAD-binding oxidoreductase [Halomonas sp. PAR7]MDT0513144.1 FAD-binding oxidoreductase [Halomonas sp. LES1]MDT0591445.1 FAD-binding oxidoreductase [Halomonas sp. PAR8]